VKAVVGRVVRPTLRCLIDDLGNEVGPVSLRATLSTARGDMAANSRFLFPVPLAAAEHLLTDKANLLALDPNADRELIVSITDRSVVKVKSSDRRGALWADADGTWWLLAAGRRKDDGSGDFYREVAKFGSDSSPIAPTADDLTYLKLETAYIADCTMERNAHTAIVEAILAAAASPGQPQTAEVFGARVGVQIDAEPGDEMLSVAFDFVSFDQRARFPVDVLGFVPGFETVDDWDMVPSMRPGAPETWYTFVPRSWISYLATSVELDGLLSKRTVPAASALNLPTAGRVAHRAAAALVTLSYVEGIEITALCGVRFVAHRDPELYDECPSCGAALELLRQTLSSES
jgi:hypothetical protein